MNREGHIWKGIAPLVFGLAAFLLLTATHFDETEIKTIGGFAAILRGGLQFSAVRGVIREMLEAFER